MTTEAPSTAHPRILVVVNDWESGPRRLIDWLVAGGWDFDLRSSWKTGIPSHEGYAGVVLLGGGYLPQETDRGPWLADEADLVRTCAADGTPVLGICLGGQMIAHAFGGEVRGEYGTPEKGATPVTVLPAAEGDPVFGGIIGDQHFIESHVDQITELPADAVLLASSEGVRIQAFRIGTCWGTQFHPEADSRNVRSWEPEKLAKLGFDKEQLISTAEAVEPEMVAAAEKLVTGFLDVVRARAAGRSDS